MKVIDLHYVTKRAARIMKLGGTPKLKIQRRRRGRAHPNKGYFTVPLWATEAHPAFAIAYVIHELSHFRKPPIGWSYSRWVIRHHGQEMRRIEAEVAERFGLRLIYRSGGCYTEEIRHLDTGRTLCTRYGIVYTDERQYEHPAALI